MHLSHSRLLGRRTLWQVFAWLAASPVFASRHFSPPQEWATEDLEEISPSVVPKATKIFVNGGWAEWGWLPLCAFVCHAPPRFS